MTNETNKNNTNNIITKNDFERYVDVQKSGIVNMWAVGTVSELTGLDVIKIMEIMHNYSKYNEEFK